MTSFDNQTPEWLHQLGDNLEDAARRSQSRGILKQRNRRTGLVAVAAVLLLSGFAFSVYEWDDSPPEPAPSAGIVADPDEPLGEPGTSPSDTSNGVDGGPLCELDGSGRRQRTVAPTQSMRAAVSALSNVDLARVNRGELTFELRAVESNGGQVPDTAECERFKSMPRMSPSICITEVSSPNGGETCAPVARIKSGQAFVVEDRIPDARAGTARIFGIAPDGVRSVRLVFRGRPGGADATENVRVTRNVFAMQYNGSAAVPPTVELIR